MEKKEMAWWGVSSFFVVLTVIYIYQFFTSGIVRFDVTTLPSGGTLAVTVLAPTTMVGIPIFIWGIIEVVIGVLAYPLKISKGATAIYTTLASFTFTFAILTTMLSQIPVFTVGV